MVDQPTQRFLAYGAELAGASAGCTLEFLQIIPTGASAPVSSAITAVLQEVTARFLSLEEKTRMASAIDIATNRISARLISGQIPRADGFFDKVGSRRTPSQELLEATLIKARDAYEERKVRYIGAFYANLIFTDYVSSSTAHLLLKQLEQLSYRQLCLIALIGTKGAIDVEPLRRPTHSDPELEALKREEMDLHATDLGTKGLISGQGAWVDQLSTLGKVIYDLAGLKEIPETDQAEITNIIESLRHKAALCTRP